MRDERGYQAHNAMVNTTDNVRPLHKPERIAAPPKKRRCDVCAVAVFAVMVVFACGVLRWALAR